MNPEKNTIPERAHDILRETRQHALDPLFAPRSVALIGASDAVGSVGQALVQNLQLFDGRVFPINPKYKTTGGLESFQNIAAVTEEVDLAVIATPASTVPGIIRECAKAGVPAAIISPPASGNVAGQVQSWSSNASPKHGVGRCGCLVRTVLVRWCRVGVSTRRSPMGWRSLAASRSSARAARCARRCSIGVFGRTSASARLSRSARCSRWAGATSSPTLATTLLVRFSQLAAEQRWVAEIDVNPLLVSSDRMLALDARIVLHPPETREETLPRLAIRPYPAGYMTPWKLRDGTSAMIRPIRPEDEPLMVKFHQTLSDRSVYLRYFTPLKLDQRIAHERLSRICFIDYDREMVLVVERRDSKTQEAEILGVGRLSKLHGANEAEFALTVRDQWQGHGLGTQLLTLLVQAGRDEKLERITATMLADNHEMQHVARKVDFKVEHIAGENEYRAEMKL